MEFPTVDGEEIKPGILFAQIPVACHDGAQSAKREAVPAKASGYKLLACALADEGQTVVSFHDLAKPAMLHGCARQDFSQLFFQPIKYQSRIGFLPGFAILAAKN